MASDAAIEAAARAMEQNAFAIFDRGYTNRNYFDERAFLNAEKVVKRARKKAKLAVHAAELVARAEAEKALQGFSPETIRELQSMTFNQQETCK